MASCVELQLGASQAGLQGSKLGRAIGGLAGQGYREAS